MRRLMLAIRPRAFTSTCQPITKQYELSDPYMNINIHLYAAITEVCGLRNVLFVD